MNILQTILHNLVVYEIPKIAHNTFIITKLHQYTFYSTTRIFFSKEYFLYQPIIF